jgi:IS5 family transposase
MFGNYAYEPIIQRHQNHLLVKMNDLIDWSFVEEEVADCYSTKGQNAIHPMQMFKLLVVQSLYELSDRAACEQADTNVIYRYFVGLGLTDKMYHWTDLGNFRERIGTEAFERLFYRVLEEAEQLGIDISRKRNADSTDIKANVDIARCAKDKQDENDHAWIDRNSSDPDARCGKKGNQPNSKRWYGYKGHINQETETELVTAVITTDAAETDESQLVPLVDKEREFRGEEAIRQQGGDKAYVGHAEELTARGVFDYVIPRDNMTEELERKNRNNHYRHLKRQRPQIERKFAEGKKHHHLRQARYRGKWKVHIQNLLTFIAINLKRIIRLVLPQFA